MRVECSREFKKIGQLANKFVKMNGRADDILRDATLQIGPANDPRYGIPASAVSNPMFVGDHAVLGDMVGATAEIEAMYKKNPLSVNMKPRFNMRTGKYDIVCTKSGIKSFTGDSGELINMQTISPWNASFFPEIFRQPLLYSHARDLVKRLGGTNPWGEVQNLQLAAYSGWGQLNSAGTVAANLKQNVNVQAGMMSASIINIKVFYNYTVEEMQRAQNGNGSPFASSLMSDKQRYAQYVIDMITDYLTYYGNPETNTLGLFDINGETTWAGQTLEEIKADPSITAKGQKMYEVLAAAITDFMGASYNKFDVITVGMAPAAYNLLTSTNYSDQYNPKSPLKIFEENFMAGVTENGATPKIRFFADPLLAANTDFSDDGLDRLVITAPEVGAGPNDEKQDLLLLGVPLENFTYPVYPNSYDQQHAVLRRFAGIFAPVAQAVKVYTGFGTKNPTVATPAATPDGGNFETSTSVTLTSATAGADIYYTTNGDEPTTSSTKYTQAIALSATTTIKAIAVKDGYYDSEVMLKTFTKTN